MVALTLDPGTLNPATTAIGAVHLAAGSMFNGLVGFDKEGRIAPELATSWRTDQDGRVYTFTLRDGVRWHDGKPFTSDDVKFTFDKALLLFHSRTRASMGSAGLSVEAPDPRTVVFRFNRPYAPLLQQLHVADAPIIPKHVYESCEDLSSVAGCTANRSPIGTGPFRFVSYTAGEIRLERNPDYFRPGLPYFDALVYRVIPDQNAQLLALEHGEVDWVWFARGPELPRLRGNRDVTLRPVTRDPGGANCVITLAFNLRPPEGRRPILTDLRVRQAITYGINRDRAGGLALFEDWRVPATPISTAIAVARAPGLPLPSFDLDRARRLLDDAGWKGETRQVRVARDVAGIADGSELSLELVHFPGGPPADYAPVLRQQLSELGINVETRAVDPATFTATVFRNRAFDAAVIPYCHETDPELGVRRQYHSSEIGPAAFSNAAGYSNPEMDSLWDRVGQDLDEARRAQLYRRIQELATQDLPYWWLAEITSMRAHRVSCGGFNYENFGLFAEEASCRR